MQHIWSFLNNAIRILAPATHIYTLTTSVWSCTAVRQTTQTRNNSERHKYSKRTQSNPQTWGPIYMFTDINVYVFNFIIIYLHIYIRTYVRSGYQPESIPRLAPHDEQKIAWSHRYRQCLQVRVMDVASCRNTLVFQRALKHGY